MIIQLRTTQHTELPHHVIVLDAGEVRSRTRFKYASHAQVFARRLAVQHTNYDSIPDIQDIADMRELMLSET